MESRESSSKRIAVFSLAYKPHEGGAEIAAREIMKRATEHAFTCFTSKLDMRAKSYEEEGGVTIVRVGSGVSSPYGHPFKKLLYIIQAYHSAERAHRQKPFDLIWGIMAAYGGAAALLFKIRHPQIPFVLTIQEGDSEAHILKRVGAWYPFWRLIIKRADKIQVISNYLAEFVKKHGAEAPVEIIPNGVDVQLLHGHALASRKKRGVYTIVTTSRLVYKNGIDILIRAAGELVKKNPEVQWQVHIVGGGPDEEKLKQLAKACGVEERVSFFGQVESEHVREHLASADIFVRPSRSEGLGSSFLEAMAAGLPVVGTPVGGIPEFLKDDVNGVMVRNEDPIRLAEKIQELYNDRARARRLALSGERMVLKSYSWEGISERMSVLFTTATIIPRLLIATGIFPPDIGGSASFSETLFNSFKRRGWGVSVVTYGEGRRANVHAISLRIPKYIRHIVFFLTVFFYAGSSHIVLAADPSLGGGFLAVCAAYIRKRKAIVRITGDYAWEQGVQRFGVTSSIDEFQEGRYGLGVELFRVFQRWTVKRATAVAAPSKYLGEMAKGWGAPQARIRIIYNGLRFEVEEEGAPVQQREKRSASKITIVTAGRLVPWKGFLGLIDAFSQLVKTVPGVSLSIVGTGPQIEKLRAHTTTAGVEHKVNFIGKVSAEEMRVLLKGADIFALNTGYEGFSHQILEAMGCGVPVVTTTSGGNPELVRNGIDGMLVPYNDVEAFRAALERLCNDHMLRGRMGKAGIEQARNFSVNRMSDSYETLCRAIIGF